ncbi:MAG: hypothetical protein OXF02_07475 [Simkaniaceae bacterium]|nr:hypothetical protein [Simkaniaceae bacterium]
MDQDETSARLTEIADAVAEAKIALRKHLARHSYTSDCTHVRKALLACRGACEALQLLDNPDIDQFELLMRVARSYQMVVTSEAMYGELATLGEQNEFARDDSVYSWARSQAVDAYEQLRFAQSALEDLGRPQPREGEDSDTESEKKN